MDVLHRKLLRDLVHARTQLAAVTLVVVAGVAVFVTLRSMHGYLLDAQASYYRAYRFADVFAHLAEAPEEVARRVARLPGVAQVATRLVADVIVEVPGLEDPAAARLVSVPAGQPPLNRLHLRSGRWVTPGARGEVIASDAFAAANGLRLGDSIGAVIHGRWQPLRIVGTAISPEFAYEIRGAGDIFPDARRFGVLWMERKELAAAFDLEGSFNDLAISLAPGAREEEVVARVDRLLEPWGGLGAYGRDSQVSHRFLSDEIGETQVTSVLMPAIFLGVTAFLLHLVLHRLVGLQRDQIAVLKAFGYRDAAVGLHFLEMALVPVLVGSVAGAALGLWLAEGMAAVYAGFFQFPDAAFHASPGVVAAGAGAAGAAALAGAVAAVRRAVTLAPAEAMRPPSPPVFRPGVLERSRLGARVPLATRIVVRHLERQPVKAGLSVLGLAFAVAILFVSWNLLEIIALLERIQFDQAAREDVTVTFRDPEPTAVLHELGSLPGVDLVEPFRTVPVRLSHGHRSRRTAIQGLPRDGRLRRIVDRNGRLAALPPSGLLLTAKLAELLDASPGEEIVVEVLEGRRPVLTLPLAATADELVGVSAYLEIGELNRLLGEGRVVSGALLDVDPARRAAVLDELGRRPGVAGVVAADAVREGFRSTLAQTLRVSFTSTVLFAVIIAFGMVTNGARIALSERGRELASLRVLGFQRHEVAAMLLGEQAVLVVLSLPLGVAIGTALCALVAFRFDTEMFRMPFAISAATVAFAVSITGAAAAISGWSVRRRIDHLDLVAVLKTRE